MPRDVVEEAEAVAAARWAATAHVTDTLRGAETDAPATEPLPFERLSLSYEARPTAPVEEVEEPWPVRLMLRHNRLVLALLILLSLLMMAGIVFFAPYTVR